MQLPEYTGDFYADEAITNPWPVYARLRKLGPVVFFTQLENYALTQHAEVQQALRDDSRFISSKGVAADQFGCDFLQGNTVASDAERHNELRKAMAPPLLPGALKKLEASIESSASELIERLASRSGFDAIADLARYLPLTIVRELVGLPDFGQDRMLKWANAAFDVLGVQNCRGKHALDAISEMREFISRTDSADVLKPGSWTARIHELVEQKHLSPELAAYAIRDYINPSLDTTISATGELIYQLGKNPQQWQLLKENPEYITGAVNEAVRLSTPIRSFSRHTSTSVEIAGTVIPAHSRVMLLFASANRDEKVFPQSDKFDVSRNPRLHLGFGSGVHMCVGMHLAQLEMRSLLKAMLDQIESIKVGKSTRALNNTISAFASLECSFKRSSKRQPVVTQQKNKAQSDEQSLLHATVLKREIVADQVISLTLTPSDGQNFPKATAGAHIDLHLCPGLTRQYSLTGCITSDQYKIAVKLSEDSAGGSTYIHEHCHEGKELLVGRPRNNFPLRINNNQSNAAFTCLVAGGIGITPLLAMAWELHRAKRPFALHIFARTEDALPFRRDYKTMPFAEHIFSHVDTGGISSENKTFIGNLVNSPTADDQMYICGPTGFIDKVKTESCSIGFKPESIFVEHFAADIDPEGEPFTVVAARSGITLQVTPEQSLLQALEHAGLHVPTACKNGVCGSCLLPVLEGTPEHRDMVQTDQEKAENKFITACCSRARSKTLVLDI